MASVVYSATRQQKGLHERNKSEYSDSGVVSITELVNAGGANGGAGMRLSRLGNGEVAPVALNGAGEQVRMERKCYGG